MRKQNRKDQVKNSDRQIPKILLTYEEAAYSLGFSQSKLEKLVSEGKIPVVVIGGNTRFRTQELEALAEENIYLKNQG